MGRWSGPRRLRPEQPEAACVFVGAAGLERLADVAPTDEERPQGWFYLGKHLDMSCTLDENGNSYLDETRHRHGRHRDLWTDECVLSAAYAGYSRGFDVVVVSDAVATAMANQETAPTIVNSTVVKVPLTHEMISYLENDFATGEPGAARGTEHPDGRERG